MQTWAIFVDAYRRLQSKRLFWLTLGLSGLVVLIVGLIGIDENGLSIGPWAVADMGLPLAGEINKVFNTNVVTPAQFYKVMFVSLGVNGWLSWGAAVLGLISTADIFPDLLSRGAIDLTLSKPISRLRLFLSHYVAGLLFVALQVTVFTLAAFLVLGVRGGAWEWGLFIAVPIVVVFFSYIYSICVLVGVWTRSAMAALLITVIAWSAIWLANGFEEKMTADASGAPLLNVDNLADSSLTEDMTDEQRALLREDFGGARAAKGENVDASESVGESANEPAGEPSFSMFQVGVGLLSITLPKTSATIQLLERWVVQLANLNVGEEQGLVGGVVRDLQEANKTLDQRSPFYIIGSSLAFEAVLMAVAAWIFCRRDY